MLATNDISDEEDENAEKISAQRPRAISGDDLGDSFTLDEEPKIKKGWVDEILERDAEDSDSEEGDSEDEENDSDEEGSDEDDESHEEGPSMKDWEQSDDESLENLDEDDGEEEDGEEDDEDDDAGEKKTHARVSAKVKNILAVETSEGRKVSSDTKKKNANDKLPTTRLDLPYLIEAPKSIEELSSLLDNCSNSDIILIINRIRASNAIKLAAENRKKMQV